MIKTIFYRTGDNRYVEVNALTSKIIGFIERSELPPDCHNSDRHIAAYKANDFAQKHNTICTGEELASRYMRTLQNTFVDPDA